MSIPTLSDKGYINILPENIHLVLELLDEKIGRILGPLSKRNDTYFFLAGGGAVLLDDNVFGVKRFSKDLDFLWVPDGLYLEEIVNNMNRKIENLIPKKEVFGDENFIALELSQRNEGEDERKKFLVEFINVERMIEENSEYDKYDFQEDLEQYFINPEFDYFRNIKICNAYVTWYTRLATLRLWDGVNPEDIDIEQNVYYHKVLNEISVALRKGFINVNQIEENIGYLIYKYQKNSPLVIQDFEDFIAMLRREYE